MISAATTFFADAPIEAQPEPDSVGAGDPNAPAFETLLAEPPTGAVDPIPAPAAVATPGGDAVASTEGGADENAAASEDQNARDENKRADEADATVISSCLAAWQILPPQPILPPVVAPAAPSAPSENGTGEIFSAAPDQSLASAVTVPFGGSPVAPQKPADAARTPPASPVTSPADATGKPAVKTAETPEPNILANAVPVAVPVPAATPATAPVPPVNPPVNQAPPRAEAPLEKSAPRITGIPGAKQQRAMSASLFQTNEKPVTAGIADATAPLLSSPHGTAPLEAGTSAGAHDFEHPPEGETPRDGAGQPVSTPSIAEVVRGFQPAKAGVESTTSSAAPEAARMIEQIEKDIERMRSQGGQRLEVRLPMRDGGEVVVKLHVEAGEVKAVFHTESSSLRDALESGWNQLASTNSDRAVKIGTVAFEGSSLQNGTGGFSQTPDQRRRALDTYQPDNVPFLNGPLSDLEKDQPNTPRRSVSTVSMAGLQIYA